MTVVLEQPKSDQPSFNILKDGENIGLLSQSSDHAGDANPGMWDFSLHTKDGGLVAFSPFGDFEAAKHAVEVAAELDLSHAEWARRWQIAEALGFTDATWAEQSFSADLV